MISVIIPLYNKEKQIAYTLQSVLQQTFQEFEIVIVNDGSTDGSVTEAQKVQDPRIRLVQQANAGVSAARNRGIHEAKYDLIAFLDADDEWKPTYLETQYQLYQQYPQCSVYACNYEFRNSEGKITPTIIRKLPFTGEDGVLSNYFEVASCSHPPLWTSAVMVKKEAITAIGGFPVGIKSGEDLLTWARLAVKYGIAFCDAAYVQYNIRDESKRELNDLRKSAPLDLKSTKDKVGTNLQALYKAEKSSTKKIYLSQYIAYWYKMRSVINLNLDYRGAAFRCALKSIRYNPYALKGYELVILSLCAPYSIIKKLLR